MAPRSWTGSSRSSARSRDQHAANRDREERAQGVCSPAEGLLRGGPKSPGARTEDPLGGRRRCGGLPLPDLAPASEAGRAACRRRLGARDDRRPQALPRLQGLRRAVAGAGAGALGSASEAASRLGYGECVYATDSRRQGAIAVSGSTRSMCGSPRHEQNTVHAVQSVIGRKTGSFGEGQSLSGKDSSIRGVDSDSSLADLATRPRRNLSLACTTCCGQSDCVPSHRSDYCRSSTANRASRYDAFQ